MGRAAVQAYDRAKAYAPNDDEGKMIGNAGSHVDALESLIYAFGNAAGEIWTFRLLTKNAPKPAPREHNDAIEHDPEPQRALLSRVMEALLIAPAKIAVTPGTGPRRSLTFVFTIHVQKPADYRMLTVPEDEFSDPLIASIGTLFRAAARKMGVRYQVNVSLTPP